MNITQKTICDAIEKIPGVKAVIKKDRGISILRAKKKVWLSIQKAIKKKFKPTYRYNEYTITVHDYIVEFEDEKK